MRLAYEHRIKFYGKIHGIYPIRKPLKTMSSAVRFFFLCLWVLLLLFCTSIKRRENIYPLNMESEKKSLQHKIMHGVYFKNIIWIHIHIVNEFTSMLARRAVFPNAARQLWRSIECASVSNFFFFCSLVHMKTETLLLLQFQQGDSF